MGSNSIIVQRTLYDIRDDNSYTIRKLADGNCWMTENLRLAGKTISSEDSNLPAGTSYALPGSSAEGWCNTADEACINKANVISAESSGYLEYGTYYSWKAATAGYGGYNAGSVNYSICPKGWKLPSGGASGEFQGLVDAGYDTVEAMVDASGPNITLAGMWNLDTLRLKGIRGVYWGNNQYNSYRTLDLSIQTDTDALLPQDHNSGYFGLSVRCIASNQDFWSISTMQEMTPEIVSSVVTPSTTAASAVTNATDYANTYDKTSVVPERILTDARDGETYRVRKLADGNVWMTENLRLTLTEGQAIEISDGSMWLPTNYDGTTTNSTTLTWEDLNDEVWYTVSKEADGANIVRSYNTAGSAGKNYCYRTTPESGSGLRPHGTEACVETYNTYDGETQQIGVYYNWYTATAGQGTFDMGEETTISICPKNWELPSLNIGSPAFSEIYETYGGAVDVVKAFPISFITTGEFGADYGSPMQYTSHGPFTTKTPNGENNYNVNRGFVNSTGLKIGTQYSSRKRNGDPVRCAISGL